MVSVPTALSYRYYGADEFILNDQTFLQDTGTADIMYYAFDVDDGATADMEGFLRDYTENVNPQLDYESKATYAAEFEGFRGMFLMLGGALSFIVGLVGVLNFFNAVLTGIITRRREFAAGSALPPSFTATASSRPILVKIFALAPSAFSFFRLMLFHFECPDMFQPPSV
mgnify:CR=1 FL=1